MSISNNTTEVMAMTEYAAQRNPNRPPVHPGVALADILADINVPKTEIASMLGISRQHLYDILRCRKSVTADVAVRLGKLLGGGGGAWVRMQAAHDLWQSEQTVDVEKIPTIRAA